MYITARNSALEIDWVLPLESDDASTVIVNKMNGKPYFLVDEYIMLPIKKNGTHRLQAVALASGQTIWEEPLAGVKGIFMYVSDYIRLGNSIYFIFSTGMEDYHEGRSPHMKAIMETDAVYNIESRIVHVNIASGEVRMTKKFPRINTYGYKKPMVTATQQLLIYALHNNVWGVGCDT